jgi:hypothetical protein
MRVCAQWCYRVTRLSVILTETRSSSSAFLCRPILVPAFSTVAADLDVTVPRIAQLNGVLVLFGACFPFFVLRPGSSWG